MLLTIASVSQRMAICDLSRVRYKIVIEYSTSGLMLLTVCNISVICSEQGLLSNQVPLSAVGSRNGGLILASVSKLSVIPFHTLV